MTGTRCDTSLNAATTASIARAVIRRDGQLLVARRSRAPSARSSTEPASQEDHLELHWLPLDQLAEADVKPGALKTALVTAGDGRTPFWHGWNG